MKHWDTKFIAEKYRLEISTLKLKVSTINLKCATVNVVDFPRNCEADFVIMGLLECQLTEFV